MNGLVGNDCIQNFEFCVSDGLLAKGSLPGTPLEPLDDGVLDGAQETLVHLRGQSVVDENVGTFE